MDNNNGNMFPVDIRTNGSDIIRLCCVIELKINRIVHMPELVHIIETDLNGHNMIKNRFLFVHILYHLCISCVWFSQNALQKYKKIPEQITIRDFFVPLPPET